MEVRDNQGRKIGTVGPAYYPGTSCIVTIAVIVAIVGGIIWGVSSLIGSIQNSIQSNALPVHDSLKNMQLQGGNSGSVYSDSVGLHITDSNYYYSGIKYGDVDVSVTVKLTGYTISNDAALAAYGLQARYTGSYNPYNLEITPTGRWFNNEYELNDTVPTDSGTPNSAIRTGVGATNTLEVRMHGTHADFFVNGVEVDEKDFPSSSTSGTIGFTARNLEGDPPNSISVVFTNLTISKDTQ